MKFSTLFSAAAALLMFAGCAGTAVQSAPTLDEVFQTRRSVRAYEAGKVVTEAEVREIITAAQNAPSWANQQPSKYYVALSPEKTAAVLEMIGGNKEKVANASAFIVSTYEKGKSGFNRGQQVNEVGEAWGAYDNGLSNAYFILKARAMGFDTLIMGMRYSDQLRPLFGIPDNEEVMAVIALGYRAADPAMPVHRPVDDIVKFF